MKTSIDKLLESYDSPDPGYDNEFCVPCAEEKRSRNGYMSFIPTKEESEAILLGKTKQDKK